MASRRARPLDAFCSGSCRPSTEILSGAHSQGQYSGAAKTVESQSRGEGDDFYNLSPSLTQRASDGGVRGDNSNMAKVRAAACLRPLPSLTKSNQQAFRRMLQSLRLRQGNQCFRLALGRLFARNMGHGLRAALQSVVRNLCLGLRLAECSFVHGLSL